MLSERDKSEEELRFLKDSYDIGVITKEEHEEGKNRVELKLKELDNAEEKKEAEEKEIQVEEIKPEEVEIKPKEEIPEIKIEEKKEIEVKPAEAKKIEEVKEDVSFEVEEIKEEPKEEIKVKKEEPIILETEDLEKEEEKVEVKEEVKVEEPISDIKKEPISEIKEEPKPEVKETPKEVIPEPEEKPKEISEEETGLSVKVFASLAVILFIVLGSWYIFFSDNENAVYIPEDTAFIAVVDSIIPEIACSSDDDCSREDKIGICSNPGKENSECNYIDDVSVSLTVLNSKDCFNCQIARVLSILKNFYPNLNLEQIELESEEGKAMVERYDVDVLPAYIFGSNFDEAYNYGKLSTAFNQVENSFVMKNTVANANYYFSREDIPKNLDLFVQEGQEASIRAEQNVKEFLDAFGKDVVFTKYSKDSQIVKELGINSFPAFLINNKIKFGGVQAADKIRENFCQVNAATGCALGLSKSLV